MGTPSQSYGTSLAIWDHTVLPATRHKWTRNAPRLTPATQAGTRFTYPGGMEGWVDLYTFELQQCKVLLWLRYLRTSRMTRVMDEWEWYYNTVDCVECSLKQGCVSKLEKCESELPSRRDYGTGPRRRVYSGRAPRAEIKEIISHVDRCP